MRSPWLVGSCFCVAIFLGMTTSSKAWASAASPSGLLIADGGDGGILEIKSHEVHVTINNGIAMTRVDQTFLNTENRIVEALYTFPVPNGASVSNFSMVINGREMIGEVVEKERARRIYESYKPQKRDPGLLEQVDFKRFEMKIFPIAAGAEQKVSITYYQELETDHDWSNFIYPLATTTIPGIDQQVHGRFSMTVDIKSEIPIAKFKSSSHPDDFVFAQHNDGYVQASLEIVNTKIDRDVVFAFQTQRAKTGIDLVTSKQVNEDGYFMMTLTAGKELEDKADAADYVFVLDVSGSMANDGKLRMSQRAAMAFIDVLDMDDRCEILTFNTLPVATFQSLRTVNPETRQQIRGALSQHRAKGGTSLTPALQMAYRYKDPDRPLNVVVLSDGMNTSGEQRELVSMIKKSPAGSRVFCVGIGNEINRGLLRQVAEGAGGIAAFISRGDDFERHAKAFRRKLTHPVASNLALTFNGLEVYDVEPKQLPSLYHGTPIRVYGRYRGAGKCQAVLRGEVMGAAIHSTFDLDLPRIDHSTPQIERMWAWHRIDALMDASRESGSDSMVKDEIVNLCETYSITSQYASFIVLENDAEYRRWKIKRRNAARITRDRNSQRQLRAELKTMRDQAMAKLGPDSSSGSKPASSKNAQPLVQTQPSPNHNFDIEIGPRKQGSDSGSRNQGGGGGGGGGAIDPVTASIAASLAIGAWAARRRRKFVIEEQAQN